VEIAKVLVLAKVTEEVVNLSVIGITLAKDSIGQVSKDGQ
jgi:hypothetical protein